MLALKVETSPAEDGQAEAGGEAGGGEAALDGQMHVDGERQRGKAHAVTPSSATAAVPTTFHVTPAAADNGTDGATNTATNDVKAAAAVTLTVAAATATGAAAVANVLGAAVATAAAAVNTPSGASPFDVGNLDDLPIDPYQASARPRRGAGAGAGSST